MSKKYNHTFTIDRARWANGLTRDIDQYGNYLRNGDKTMCCLGFACQSYGVTAKELVGIGIPRGIRPDNMRNKLPDFLNSMSSPHDNDFTFVRAAARCNDSNEGNFKAKEKEIAAMFAKHGVKVEFVGKYK